MRPNLLVVRYTLLNVPGTGNSNHLRIYWLSIECMFSEIQVLGNGATVKYHELERSECREEFFFRMYWHEIDFFRLVHCESD